MANSITPFIPFTSNSGSNGPKDFYWDTHTISVSRGSEDHDYGGLYVSTLSSTISLDFQKGIALYVYIPSVNVSFENTHSSRDCYTSAHINFGFIGDVIEDAKPVSLSPGESTTINFPSKTAVMIDQYNGMKYISFAGRSYTTSVQIVYSKDTFDAAISWPAFTVTYSIYTCE